MTDIDADASTPEARAARRSLLAADVQARTGISEAMIGSLVETFYGRVRGDTLLGPVFATVADWDDHLARLKDFWSSVVLTSGRYQGQPMLAHLKLGVRGAHFERWLDLFETTARDICPPAAAELFIDKARRIADSLEMGIATARGEITAPRHVKRA